MVLFKKKKEKKNRKKERWFIDLRTSNEYPSLIPTRVPFLIREDFDFGRINKNNKKMKDYRKK
jgi:hypothetical protein